MIDFNMNSNYTLGMMQIESWKLDEVDDKKNS